QPLSPMTEYGQTSGSLDEEALFLVGIGDKEVYLRRDPEETGAIDLTLLIDESGSMGTGERWRMAAATALSLEYALRPVAAARLRVYGFTSDCFEEGETILYRHFDSSDPRRRNRAALAWCIPKDNNADGVALAAI